MSAPQDAPTVLTQDRGKLALLNLIGVVFVALGVWLIKDVAGDRAMFIGLLSVGFFGFCLAIGIVAIIRPARLTIEPSGLAFSSVFRARRWAWAELQDIQLTRQYSNDVISIQTRTASGVAGRLQAGVGVFNNGGIPGGWPVSTQELYGLLVDAKARWDTQRHDAPT